MEYIKQWAINDKEKKEYVRGKFNKKDYLKRAEK